jgi:MYXO-CTERM domain-containing protein
MRANVDVSAVADNVAVYGGGGWGTVGGTSCASPFVAALLTRVGLSNRDNAFFYANTSAFYDVTQGNNDPSNTCNDVMCNCGVGWDGPTGWGTPNGMALAALGASTGDDGGPGADATVPGDGSAGDDASGGTESGPGDDATTPGGDSGGTAGLDGGPIPHVEAGNPGDGGNGDTGSSSGCGCRTAGSSTPAQSAALLVLAMAGITARVRRRR